MRINNPPRINQPPLPQKKCNLKTGGPPRLINRWAYPRLINYHFESISFLSNSSLIGTCWFTKPGVQEKKKEPKWLRFRKSIYLSKIFSHRNLLVYPTRGAGKKQKKMLKKSQNGCGFGNLSIHLKSFPIGICWFTEPGVQGKKKC